MATLQGARLTDAHRRAQARLGALTVQQMRQVWPLLDPEDLDGSFDRWLRTVVPLIQGQRSTSARLAANYLTTFKALELGVSAPRAALVLAEVAPAQAVATSMLVTGPAAIKSAMRRGVPLVRALTTAEVTSARAAMRHALNGGRDTISESVRADRQARGWERVTGGSACKFCTLLASRGAVYGEDTAHFEAHDGCSCSAQPVFT